jgi:putative PIN family toxin of toxin-antitoxin system
VLRCVLDTSVIVAGLRSRRGASNAVLELVAARRVRPLATVALFLEYEDVLCRPEQRLAMELSIDDVDEFLKELAALMEPVIIDIRWRPQLTDPGDELVLEAAVNGRADALVTFNLAHLGDAAHRFGIPACTPRELLRRFRP